ncbi:DUF6415 family natural product biosynthesis protein [Streptomyces spectabilis]|uniref:DUF6415 family natural product biosynthesis protein n=1 Tax=Streptomyces spectabilis TaxID=68270 RepID=UPI0033D66048
MNPRRGFAVLHALKELRCTRPFRWDQVLDDAVWAIDAQAPDYACAWHLRGHLRRLADIATAGSRIKPLDKDTLDLVDRARELVSSQAPATAPEAVAHLRALGQLASELVDQLIAAHHISPPVTERDVLSAFVPPAPVLSPC